MPHLVRHKTSAARYARNLKKTFKSVKSKKKGRPNKIKTGYRGKLNQIRFVRSMDAKEMNFGINYVAPPGAGYGRKSWSATVAGKSCAVINFPNFSLNMLPKYEELQVLFQSYKINALSIKLIPVDNFVPTENEGANSGSYNVIVNRFSTKYDTAYNENRFNNTYGEDDVIALNQIVKKSTKIMPAHAMKTFSCYTRHPRKLTMVVKDISDVSQTTLNVAGGWNSTSDADIQFLANDCIYIRNAEYQQDLGNEISKFRVLYTAYISLAGFQ